MRRNRRPQGTRHTAKLSRTPHRTMAPTAPSATPRAAARSLRVVQPSRRGSPATPTQPRSHRRPTGQPRACLSILSRLPRTAGNTTEPVELERSSGIRRQVLFPPPPHKNAFGRKRRWEASPVATRVAVVRPNGGACSPVPARPAVGDPSRNRSPVRTLTNTTAPVLASSAGSRLNSNTGTERIAALRQPKPSSAARRTAQRRSASSRKVRHPRKDSPADAEPARQPRARPDDHKMRD
jgi:hypothetical protein